ncbi:hypothetical protein C7A12_15000 [Pseudomonas fluorescens]|nr:hypothetical protein C7A12_15000 [Pseudomonas fluorescens]PRW77860.1 hypothetical protein C7A13_14610 [Pseudomonas fluorescens]
MIVPTLCVGMPRVPLRVTLRDAERPGLCSHAERGNNPQSTRLSSCSRYRYAQAGAPAHSNAAPRPGLRHC